MTYREWEMFNLLNCNLQMEEFSIVLMGEAFLVSLLHLPTISFIFLPTLYYICWQGLSYLSPSASEPLSATQLCTGVSPIKSACSTWSFSIPSCISLATFGSSNESHFINTNNDSCSPVMMIINPKKRSKI